MLTPMEIQNKDFKRGFRGYNEEEVDAFMNQIASDYEIIFRDNREMREVIEQLRDKLSTYENMESAMTNTLMMAQETAESVKASAHKEADLIRRAAEQSKKDALADTAQALREGQERYEHVRQEVAVFRAKIESLLKSQLQLLEGMELPECREMESILAIDEGHRDPEPIGDPMEEELIGDPQGEESLERDPVEEIKKA